MKSATAPLISYLSSSSSFNVADLYTFTKEGVSNRITSCDVATQDASGNRFTPGAVRRSMTRTAIGTEISTMAIELGGQGWSPADTEGSTVTVERGFYGFGYSSASLIGSVILFKGTAYEVQSNSTVMTVHCKSAIATMERPVPPRVIQPQCPYQVYASGTCGVSTGTFSELKTVSGSSTTTVIVTTTSSSFAVPGSWIVFETGDLQGAKRTIASVSGSTMTLLQPLAAAPAAGVMITIYRGCDKTLGTCRSVFNNARYFGGFPGMPPTDVVAGSTR